MELRLTIDELASEYLLVQAFKKTVSYIRYHNWFADSVELDRASADLPHFLSQLSERVKSESWQPKPLHLVMAPKAQSWEWSEDSQRWGPLGGHEPVKLRPIAHVALEDQVLATAVMLCLANRVETAQGDPRLSPLMESGRVVRSYGNRLFCDVDRPLGQLKHRWASQALYRAYFQDYQTFINRTDHVARLEALSSDSIYLTQSDLAQFYDRIRPAHLSAALRNFMHENDDRRFFELTDQLFNWNWFHADQSAVRKYAEQNNIGSMDSIALPQGLVASGFLANVVLHSFDKQISSKLSKDISPGVQLRDYSRYVDDMRFVWAINSNVQKSEVPAMIEDWLVSEIDDQFEFLRVSLAKTESVEAGGSENHLVNVSRKMQRIQRGISGGFDAGGGKDLIQGIEALVKSQAAISLREDRGDTEPFKAVRDVKSDTVNRFAAGRFRAAYRSLRPLLPEGDERPDQTAQTRTELDQDAHSFALDLINAWKDNPANVRLLRIGLDLWPSTKIIEQLLGLFLPYVDGTVKSREAKKVAHYCLSEVYRAASTETGFTSDDDALPDTTNVEGYRDRLYEFADKYLLDGSVAWYLQQQAVLFIAAYRPKRIPKPKSARGPLSSHYDLVNFLADPTAQQPATQLAISAVVSYRSFPRQRDRLLESFGKLEQEAFYQISSRDIQLAREIYQRWNQNINLPRDFSDILADSEAKETEKRDSLREIVKRDRQLNKLRNEIGILSFALEYTKAFEATSPKGPVTPSDVRLIISELGQYGKVDLVEIRPEKRPTAYSELYSMPTWVEQKSTWRISLGYLLRYILTAQLDFSLSRASSAQRLRGEMYQPTKAHRLLRQYGFYNGHEAFGDDWLPMSHELQGILFSLLRWPGCRQVGDDYDKLGIEGFREKILSLLELRISQVGEATKTLFLPVIAPNPSKKPGGRPLRGCVVQSVIPHDGHFRDTDLELNDPQIRRQLRNHLTSGLAAVTKMLELRETHAPGEGRLDWIVFPELAIHPEDVDRYLIPYARARKTIVLAGLVYERLVATEPLVNSAIWVLPIATPSDGLQMIKLRQGKRHLSPMENGLQPHIHGFRPCQWLIGYQWSSGDGEEPLWLSASVCYDATDLGLASDLRHRSDVFAIPALNRDVGTFDNMAHALHYHMFQPVLVANNGAYGGSNKYSPKGAAPYTRQVFHTHGQPQATISFFEIPDIDDLTRRWEKGYAQTSDWKYPPAREPDT